MRERPVSEDRRDERSRQHQQPDRRRYDNRQREAERPVERCIELLLIVFRVVRSKAGEDHRRERN